MNAHAGSGAMAGAAPMPDLLSYDMALTAFSGGKDSIACVLKLIEDGFPRERMLLIHHHVDGKEGSTLFDWASTPGYVQALADHWGITLIHSWRVGGLEGEMMRVDAPTAAVRYIWGDEPMVHLEGSPSSPRGTRLKFPQVSASLSVRWCSSVGKIDVASRVIRNDPRFTGLIADPRTGRTRPIRILFLTGERAEESPNRARYAPFEPHRDDLRHGRVPRHFDHWRPVLYWSEAETWNILRRHGVKPHPAYYAGFGRLSCRNCIFLGPRALRSLEIHDPAGFSEIAAYEARFGRTIHRTHSVRERAASAEPFEAATAERMAAALSGAGPFEVTVDPKHWEMPAGAFKGHSGPS